MKKKIAFVIGQMDQGGPVRSLLNLLPLIDYSKYDVTIILFRAGGIFFHEIPSYIRIVYAKPRGLFCTYYEDKISYTLWLPIRIMLKIFGIILINIFKKEKEYSWKLKEIFIKSDPYNYDLGMSFVEGTSIYYLVKFINARIKIGRIPTDYISAKLNKNFDLPYFQDLDYLFSITLESSKILESAFPLLKEKMKVFELITSRKEISKKASEYIAFKDDYNGIRILTLSRLHITKGTDLIIKTCQVLNKRNIKYKWYVLGAGPMKKYQKMVFDSDVAEQLELVSPKSNPFPYLKEVDIYVQPSQYEGKSNAINEAKALSKPIIITRFKTSSSIINHMENGLITEMNPNSLADAILQLAEDETLRNKFRDYWNANFKSNEEQANKIFNLI